MPPLLPFARNERIGSLTVLDCIHGVGFLEQRLGAETSYAILEPFAVDAKDAVAIQIAAKKIAHFVGLSDLVFIVAQAKQAEKVAGNVELTLGQTEVFIEIAPDAAAFPASVLAIRATTDLHARTSARWQVKRRSRAGRGRSPSRISLRCWSRFPGR